MGVTCLLLDIEEERDRLLCRLPDEGVYLSRLFLDCGLGILYGLLFRVILGEPNCVLVDVADIIVACSKEGLHRRHINAGLVS